MYLSNRINATWVDVFKKVDIPLQDLMLYLTTTYNNVGEDCYMYNIVGTSYLYPKKHQILRPFRKSNFDDLNVIFIGHQPYNYGIGTGIPFEINPRELEYHQTQDVAINALAGALDEYNQTTTNLIDLDSWYDQGVLTLYSSMTRGSNEATSHLDLWEPIMTDLLLSMYEANPKLIFAIMGIEAAYSVDKLPVDAIIIDAPKACFYPMTAFNEFCRSDLFGQIDEELKKQNKKINWL